MSDRAARRAGLEQLRAARASGKREYKVQEDTAIFDTVTEEDYKLVVSDRLARDDFIEEDNGVSGYADNGEDHWDNRDPDERQSSSEDENEKEAARRAKRKAKDEKEKARLKAAEQRRKLKQVVPDGANPYIKPQKNEAEADDFMASLIGDLDGDNSSMTAAASTPAHKPKPIASRPIKSALYGIKRRAEDDPLVTRSNIGRVAAISSDAAPSDPYSSDAMPDAGPSSDGGEVIKKTRFDNIDDALGDVNRRISLRDDDAMDVDEKPVIKSELGDEDEEDLFLRPKAPVVKPKGLKRQLVNSAGAAAAPSTSSVKPNPDIKPLVAENSPAGTFGGRPKAKGTDWKVATSELAVASGPLFEDDTGADAEAEPLPVPESLRRRGKQAPKIVIPSVNALEDDGSIRFWWFDYVESATTGNLFLVGKVKARGGKDDGKWVSACVAVSGIKRKLYVLPRKKALDDEGNELDYDDDDEEGLEFDDVAMDIETKFEEEYGVTGLEITQGYVRRKYAFGIKGIPREETDWVEVKCDFPKPSIRGGESNEIPLDASGERFSHVFGTRNSAFELFVVERKIMGPCWLNIKAPTVTNDSISWTRLELSAHKDSIELFDQDDVNAPKSPPPLTIMSLSMRSVVHLNENRRELVCASARFWTDCNIDDTTPIGRQPSRATTLVRNLFTPFPTGFEAEAAKSAKDGSAIVVVRNEEAMLNQLLAIIARQDPDVIVGHDFIAADLDVMIKRMQALRTENWSRLGRFRREKWPKTIAGKNGGVLNGRLILDLNCDGSRSIIESQTWSLTEMCSTHLGVAREDIDLDDTPKFFDNVHSTKDHLLHFVMHCLADTYLQMAVAFKVQALPLTRQLTNLAGNSWNKTLQGQRAERNEYILLHRFNEHGYVVPDKIARWELQEKEKAASKNKKKKSGVKDEAEGEDGSGDLTPKAAKVSMTKKKFTGGLVFEPEKGLFDRFVLVMDFNSLYPSIIQEYDIDFSTIDWTVDGAEDIESMPERMPCEGEPQGILPQLIASLVARRRQVKNLMKDKSLSASRLQQYEIAQKALKLTANSMYGCLGFEGSRFYALPLAALTTYKGREILTRTKADAENLDLKVIYGDTDSIFINTNQTERATAIKIGNEFKKTVNDKYRKLEIDTDAVFERILLLNKKKYAARKVEDDGSISTEIKGLDMKRREYCELSKNASQFVLDKILSGESTENVVEQIHDYLTQLGEDIRAGRIKHEQFVIIKRLGKNPQDYPDAKSLPHVQVALRMKARGQNPKALDVIPYIFCLPENKESAKSAKAENAYHPDEVRRNNLTIDVEVYLHAQILPPIERLCDPIEGTEKARLAECLGLDTSRYASSSLDLPEHHFKTLNSQISDAVRFKDVDPLRIKCRVCSNLMAFGGIDKAVGSMISKSGFFCTNMECLEPLSVPSMAVQLDLQIRSFISKFYEGWIVCDEPTCGNRTRMMSVYGRVCLVPNCKGQVHFEYNDNHLYTQLLYFDTLFDVGRIRGKLHSSAGAEIGEILEAQKIALAQLRAVVTKHLDKNGRRWVSMSSLFSFMNRTLKA
ncbi:DNA-directed DNA polymerase alpha catalytic subunit pol1 [Microbotryomycetes sp. JL201]|nr:DNA-directed DNA polymerase alpha catalytic subunit pol1 [Microbotryomycetes sp. JL201]